MNSGAGDFTYAQVLLPPSWLVPLTAITDLLIAAAYIAIPLAIFAFLRRRPSTQLRSLAVLFAVVIMLCGVTHLIGFLALWWPIEVAEGVVKLITAAASVTTAVLILPLVPKAAAIPSHYELQQVNARLSKEIVAHEQTLAELRAIRDSLERRVEDRTHELTQILDQSSLLARELAHRSKNLLAVVQSMARQTVRSSKTVEEFEHGFLPRLHALAAVNDELVRNNWRGGDLERLVRTQLEPFATQNRVSISGPQLFISAEAVQNVGLAIHELATNASKHGALANHSGHVQISWAEERALNDTEPIFRICWIEDTTASAREPARCGFGHVVLTRIVPMALSGSAQLEVLPDGLRWTLQAPAAAVLRAPGKG